LLRIVLQPEMRENVIAGDLVGIIGEVQITAHFPSKRIFAFLSDRITGLPLPYRLAASSDVMNILAKHSNFIEFTFCSRRGTGSA